MMEKIMGSIDVEFFNNAMEKTMNIYLLTLEKKLL